jgi:hypothetical protein
MAMASPVALQVFRELKVANSALLRAMAREKRARASLATACAALAGAKRNVQLLLQAVQPELFGEGVLDQDRVTLLGESRAAGGSGSDILP